MAETAPSPQATSPHAHDGTDLPVGNWVDRVLPVPARPYARLMRLDRPIGTWLLLFPCWWSLALAPGPADARLLLLFVLFGLGALIMRGAGCTWNDVTDREFDAKVARTRTRPIPSGQVSVRQALAFMVAQMLLGLAILLTFNRFAVAVGAASLVLVFTYPLMKRVTYWPQFFLGLAFNYGALLGWSAVVGDLGWPAIALYLAGIAWTLGYDTIYAHQDKEDDALIGVKSTALRFGSASKPWLVGFYIAAIALLALTGALRDLNWIFFGALALGAVQLAWQIWDADLDDPADCLRKFKSNRLFGWLMLAGIFLAAHWATWTS